MNRLPLTDAALSADLDEATVLNTIAIAKGNERYIFVYDDANRAECLRTMGRFASNPDLSFTWFDCAQASQRIRQGADKERKAKEKHEQ